MHYFIPIVNLKRVKKREFKHAFAVNAILSKVPINILQRWLSRSSIFISLLQSIQYYRHGYETVHESNTII
jgi:hypothetical protein